MKLSHLLLAALVTSGLNAVAQTETKTKNNSTKTSIAKEKKPKKDKQILCADRLSVDTTKVVKHHYCPACGRG
jgi:hypothetical protein